MTAVYKKFYIPKKDGSFREILAPSEKLKEKQREILKKLYQHVAPPKYATGFVPGRGVVKNAMPHVGKKFVLNVDIRDFFTSCKRGSLPVKVTEVLTSEELDLLFCNGYLPQGAPTSPYVANFYLESADYLIHYLLKLHISDDVVYTRYADDLTISSNSKAIFSKQCLGIIRHVLRHYGFEINEKKIRKMSPSSCKEVTGLCVNSSTPTLSRRIRRKIRAMVHNAVTGRGKQEDIRKIEGYLSLLEGIPAHKELAKALRRKLHESQAYRK